MSIIKAPVKTAKPVAAPKLSMAQRYKDAHAKLYAKAHKDLQARIDRAKREKDYSDRLVNNFIQEVIQMAEKE